MAGVGFAGASAALRPAAVTGSTTTAVVARGDTLWSLAERHLGDGNRYPEILALNPGVNAHALAVGAPLRLPARSAGAGSMPAGQASASLTAASVEETTSGAGAGPSATTSTAPVATSGGWANVAAAGRQAWNGVTALAGRSWSALRGLGERLVGGGGGGGARPVVDPTPDDSVSPGGTSPDVPTAIESTYASQRDNATSYDQSSGRSWTYDRASGDQYLVADRMCNVTSLAMALSTMMGSASKARALVARVLDERYGDKAFSSLTPEQLQGKQLEDLLDVVVQREYDVSARSSTREAHSVYEKVLDIFSEYDESGIADATFLADYDSDLYKNAKKRLTEDVVRDGKTVQQLLEQGDVFVIRSVIPGGGHISTLTSVSADGITLHDPYGVNVSGANPTYANCLLNEVAGKDREHNLGVLKALVGWTGGAISDSVPKRTELMNGVLASDALQRRFSGAPSSTGALSNLAYYFYKAGDYDHAAPLFGQFGESVFYSWAECKALQVPSMLLDVKKR